MPKILLVEDNEENRDSLSRRLQRRGCAIVTAADGNVGLAMARSEKPDLILMDMNMPELDGWEATRQMKATEELRDVPIRANGARVGEGPESAPCSLLRSKPFCRADRPDSPEGCLARFGTDCLMVETPEGWSFDIKGVTPRLGKNCTPRGLVQIPVTLGERGASAP